MLFSKDHHGYVYKWTEISTGKWYIGSRSAKGCHVNDGYICSSKIVKPLIIENPNNWIRDILFIGDSKFVVEFEASLLVELDAAKDPMSYNLCNTHGHWNNVGRSMPHTLEHRRKIGLAHQGKTVSEETRRKQSESAKIKIFTSEHRQHIGDATRGIARSDEIRRKISAGKTNPSEETRAKYREHGRNRPIHYRTCPHCNKTVDYRNYGKYHGDKCRVLNPDIVRNQYCKGKACSDETKKKISERRLLTEKKTCPHCNSTVSICIYGRLHGDNCKKNPNGPNYIPPREPITRKCRVKKLCPHCNNMVDGSNYVRYHGDNCKHNPSSDRYDPNSSPMVNKKKHQCPHCDASVALSQFRRSHGDNCRYNINGPNYKPYKYNE